MQALINMDDIIQSIGLTMLDGDDRDVCRFARGQVPYILLSPLDVGFSSSNSNSTSSPLDRDRERDRKCGCANLIAQQAPSSPDGVGRRGGAEQYTNRPYYLPWPAEWTEKEVRDEEVRRLCWSAVTLVSDYVAKCEAFNDEAPRFFLADAANVSFWNFWFSLNALLTLLLLLISLGSSSRAKYSTACPPTVRLRRRLTGSRRKNPFGHCIAEACSCGISAIGSDNPVRRKNALNRRTRRLRKPRHWRIR